MPATKPHGHKRKHLFKVGDLVRWNRWHLVDFQPTNRAGRLVYKQQMHSHLGIVLEVYQSDSKARCWTADVKFVDAKLDDTDYWGIDGRPIPVNCLEVTK